MYTFILRNTLIKIPKDEFFSLTDEPWYISNLLKYSKDSNDELYINEDDGVFMSIIESLRYKDLIILNTVNPTLMYYLSDKWCLPQWLLDKLKHKMNESKLENIVSKYLDQSLNPDVKKCINCQEGFHINENNNSSCSFHTGHIIYSRDEAVWNCCYEPRTSIGCKIGYHVSETPWYQLKTALDELKKITINRDN
jgi:hypothetical protein